jgi:chemotaxis protein methyltransferase CheR
MTRGPSSSSEPRANSSPFPSARYLRFKPPRTSFACLCAIQSSRGAADREPFVNWLVTAVRVRSGIAVEEQVRQKLARITLRLPLTEIEKWLSLLATVDSAHPEWLALLESLTNHETYFFRDLGQLEHLQREVLAPLVARERLKAVPSITIWSAASSSGEELYSVASD